MKTLLLILFLCLPQLAFSNDLDKVIVRLNQRFSPVTPGNSGYDFDYRSEDGVVWININHTQTNCGVEDISVILNGHVFTTKENVCRNQWLIGDPDGLMQIKCRKHTKAQCIKALANQVNEIIIKEMIVQRIRDVEIK